MAKHPPEDPDVWKGCGLVAFLFLVAVVASAIVAFLIDGPNLDVRD